MRSLAIAVVTSLYPSPPRPREGIFAERRWTGMAARGHRVRVVHPQPRTPPLARGAWAEIAAMPRAEERAGVPVARPRYWHLPGRARGNARRFARAALAALQGPGAAGAPDVVVADYAWPAAAVAPALAARGVPCVVCGRGSDVLEVAGEAGLAAPLAAGLRAAGRWCAVSRDLVEAMDRLGGAPGRGVLVPNGVDLERFRPRERGACRRAQGLAPDGPLVLVVGHLIPRKDPRLALEAFRRGAPADARLVFVGRGPLEAELSAAAAPLGGRVALFGERDPEALAELYGAADLVLLTSTREGRPNVVLEALAAGRPVLATSAGGTAELLEGLGDPRLVADTRDPDELALRLADLLAHPPAPEALRAAVAPLTWGASLDALEGVLADAVGGRR